MKNVDPKELVNGAFTAKSMAEALWNEACYNPCGTRTKRARKALISSCPERSLHTRQQSAKMLVKAKEDLAKNIDVWQTWSNGDEVIQDQIDFIASLSNKVKTGIDRYNPELRNKKATILLEIRRLIKDYKKLLSTAVSISNKELVALYALNASVPEDFRHWAKDVVNEVMNND